MSLTAVPRAAGSLFALTATAAVLAGCGDTETGTVAPTAPASSSRELDNESAHAASRDRDCDGASDIDDPRIAAVPDRDGDRYGDACDQAPSDPTIH